MTMNLLAFDSDSMKRLENETITNNVLFMGNGLQFLTSFYRISFCPAYYNYFVLMCTRHANLIQSCIHSK